MLGFFKARTRTAAPVTPAASSAKPSMKVTPRGKTSRYRTFHKDEKGDEHGNRILVQDEDDNWYSEERNSKTGEVGYREYKVAGAGTDTKYNSITGRKEPVAEYDSKKQRIASDLAKYNQTLRQEGDYSKSSVEGLPHGLRMNVYAGVKNTKEFGDSVYLPPVEHRNKKTVEREIREASYRESASKIGEYMGEKPKPTGTEAWDYYTGRDSKAKKIYGEYTVRPKAPSGAKSTFEDIDALAEAHKVKPKAPSGPKPGEGYDSFDAAVAKPHVKPKSAGTESTGSAGSSRKYSDAETDAFFSRLRPERTFRVDPSGEATETPPDDKVKPKKPTAKKATTAAAAAAKPTGKGGRPKKSSS